jgi:hypothetical protein
MRTLTIATMAGAGIFGILCAAAPPLLLGSSGPGQGIRQRQREGDREECLRLVEESRALRHRIQTMDTALDELVSKMNQAEGAARIDAMADVIDELVEQRKILHERHMTMQHRMMRHMMEHMRSGAGFDEVQRGLDDCPLRQEFDLERERGRGGN